MVSLMSVFAAAGLSVAASQEARELGYIVGTAEMCSLSMDAERVATVVTGRLEKLGAEARSTFELASSGRRYRLTQMGSIERATACAMHKANAKRYGLID